MLKIGKKQGNTINSVTFLTNDINLALLRIMTTKVFESKLSLVETLRNSAIEGNVDIYHFQQ
ncbi:hypothetical protein NIES4103_30300 [Nostoc sp. NIES-4103]|nr:hypothetical protein NIES4103_30300 [Nostoc sp. NIES-4103]